MCCLCIYVLIERERCMYDIYIYIYASSRGSGSPAARGRLPKIRVLNPWGISGAPC